MADDYTVFTDESGTVERFLTLGALILPRPAFMMLKPC